jgi:hypothetical protein
MLGYVLPDGDHDMESLLRLPLWRGGGDRSLRDSGRDREREREASFHRLTRCGSEKLGPGNVSYCFKCQLIKITEYEYTIRTCLNYSIVHEKITEGRSDIGVNFCKATHASIFIEEQKSVGADISKMLLP